MANIKGTVQDAPDIGFEESDELLVRAANMNIKQYVPRQTPGVYDDEVDTLIKVDDETGYQNSIEILVPEAEVKKHKRYFTKSAHNRSKTARIVNGEQGTPQGNGGVLLEFVLTTLVERKTKPKDAPAANDVPEKVEA